LNGAIEARSGRAGGFASAAFTSQALEKAGGNMNGIDQSMIRLEGVTKVFTTDEVETHALSGVYLEIKKGEFVSIEGPSGCGKSTLLSILGLLDSPTEGQHYLAGKPVAELPASERARIRNREVGFVFQSFNLIGDLTVYENVELPLTYRGMRSSERRERVRDALERVGMSHRERHVPSQLSGGQQQRVAIARALVHEPRLLVCDEPTAALDANSGRNVMELLRRVAVEPDRAVIVVTHDSRVFDFGDRIVYMSDGRVERIEEQGRG
jgi:putative ABC transport system ATP-binding protein